MCVFANAPVVAPSVLSELLQHCYGPHRPQCLNTWSQQAELLLEGMEASGMEKHGEKRLTGVCNNLFYYKCVQNINTAAVFLNLASSQISAQRDKDRFTT